MPSSNRNRAENATDAPERPSRDTATFTHYYKEAYNKIVEPRRLGHYFRKRWMRELGPVAACIVEQLRGRCYWHREDGVLRDETEVSMEELAASIGVERTTIYRQFKDNKALALFVRKVAQYKIMDGKPRKIENAYQVAMDDPIHPDDMELYEALKEAKEAIDSPGVRILREEKPFSLGHENGTLQSATNRDLRTLQSATQSLQNATTNTSLHFATTNDELPSGSLYTLDYAVGGSVPPINPPKGKGEDAAIIQRPTQKDESVGVEPAPRTEAERLGEVWSKVVPVLETLIEKRRILTYFGEGRIQLTGLDATTATFSGATVLVDSARGKFTDALMAAFGSVLGRPINVIFSQNSP